MTKEHGGNPHEELHTGDKIAQLFQLLESSDANKADNFLKENLPALTFGLKQYHDSDKLHTIYFIDLPNGRVVQLEMKNKSAKKAAPYWNWHVLESEHANKNKAAMDSYNK